MMTSKMIAIREDLYEKLQKMKTSSQSFSDIIEELLMKAKKNPLAHFGIGQELLKKNSMILNYSRER